MKETISIHFPDIVEGFVKTIEAKLLKEDQDNWEKCLGSIDRKKYVPLQYKPGFLKYQEAYFKDVYEYYEDISVVLYRGGSPCGIWPVCLYVKNNSICFGTAGTSLMGPLFTNLSKAEAQRSVIEKFLSSIFDILENTGEERGGELCCSETILEDGMSQWTRKLMEHGAKESETRWQAFVDLSLSTDEIQSRIRRTNKYSIAKGQNDYDIDIYDENSPNLDQIFEEFHAMHREVAGRETRGQATWDWQKRIVKESNDVKGRSFVIFIRDKNTGVLAGSALFDSTPQTGVYCVAAYDRSRFSKPVGHIVQAIAIKRMRSMGIRWYEIGERAYPGNNGVNQKLVDIGHYKEGFATHFYPRVFVTLDSESFKNNILK